MSTDGRSLTLDYFDGHSARPRLVRLRADGRLLLIEGEGVQRQLPLAEVQWPERQRHGARVAHLPDGGSLHCTDAAAFDEFVFRAGVHESLVVRAQQSWRATVISIALLVLVCAAGYLWGLPIAARTVLAFVPASVDRSLGQTALQSLGEDWLQPSALPPAQQQRLREAFARAVEQSYPAGARPAYELHFHKSRIGPNAFALPGGSIVLTDELVQLVQGREDVVLGVLAHELGHVRHRHGMRSLVQVTLLGTITSIAFGDFSSVLAGAPALLGQLAYSRDFEREADRESAEVLRRAGVPPEVMVHFFEKMRQRSKGKGDEDGSFPFGIALASHPADEERMRFFRDAERP